ncbi:hypothetical protein HYW94_01615 [Candidatus Uhrbacteria bacterium]|nr:hypothetical protein [Candidatus Uhrbacteria bacterium]
MEDVTNRIVGAAKNYERGVGLLQRANVIFDDIEDSINQRIAIRSLSGSLARAGLMSEARKLQVRMRDQDDEHAVGIIQADIAKSKAKQGQTFEADWEAQKISDDSQQAYARRDLIAEKIKAGKFDEAIDDIGFLKDRDLVLELYCDLAEEAARRHHSSTAKFFQLAHKAAEQFLPYKFNGILVDDHPYSFFLNAYRAAGREHDIIDLIMGEKDLVRDLLLKEMVERWTFGEEKNFSLVLSLAERIDAPLERASTFASIALFQSFAKVDEDAALAEAERALAQADASCELYPDHIDMVRAEIAKAKSFKDPEAALLEAEDNSVSDLLSLEVSAVRSYADSGDYEKALEVAHKLYGIDRVQAFEYIALSHMLDGNRDKACETLNNIVDASTRLSACASLISTLTFRKDFGVMYVPEFFSIAHEAYEEISDTHTRDKAHVSYIRICARIGECLVALSRNTIGAVREKEGITEISKLFCQKAKERDRIFLLCLAHLFTDEEKKTILKKVRKADILYVQEIFHLSQNL